MVSERVNGSMKSPRESFMSFSIVRSPFDLVAEREVINARPIESETDPRMLARLLLRFWGLSTAPLSMQLSKLIVDSPNNIIPT
jgi:hypothetical protein